MNGLRLAPVDSKQKQTLARETGSWESLKQTSQCLRTLGIDGIFGSSLSVSYFLVLVSLEPKFRSLPSVNINFSPLQARHLAEIIHIYKKYVLGGNVW